MNKQEAIERIESNALNIGDNDLVLGLSVAKHIINQINEPQKIAVPQFLADWYEENKDDIEYNLYKLCTDFREQKLRVDLNGWFGNDGNKPIETLVKMKLYGYEVEKEQLYTVEIPNPNGRERPILYKNRDGKVSVIFASNPCWRTVKNAQLTESEIKEYFGWAWPFAEEVEK